ncbi:MAG: putative secreted protein [Solirubrobacterales bacterium]|nr:putative secreted protein [Solirubrobacterales bacterium]
MKRTPSARRRVVRAGLLASCTAMLLCALLGAGAGSALAANSQLKEEFAEFLDCPEATAGVCTVAHTTSGEFKMGTKDVPIEKPITLQGGLAFSSLQAQPLIPARDGNTLISPPQKVPGGLLGIGLIEGIGGEVTATATIAGPATGIQVNQYFLAEGGGIAVVLPLKIKLDNPLLGGECLIGSDSEPVVLHLTTTKMGTIGNLAKGKITKISNVTLEDTAFAVPAAKNCGISTVLVNLLAGLPSGAGHNKAVMIGDFEQTLVQYALKYAKPPKEKKKK